MPTPILFLDTKERHPPSTALYRIFFCCWVLAISLTLFFAVDYCGSNRITNAIDIGNIVSLVNAVNPSDSSTEATTSKPWEVLVAEMLAKQSRRHPFKLFEAARALINGLPGVTSTDDRAWASREMYMKPLLDYPALNASLQEVCFIVKLEAGHACPPLYVDETPLDALPTADEPWPMLRTFKASSSYPARIVMSHAVLDRLPQGDHKGRLQLQSLLAREVWSLHHPTVPSQRPRWVTVASWIAGFTAAHKLERHTKEFVNTFRVPKVREPAWLWGGDTGNPLLERGKALHIAWRNQQIRDQRFDAEKAILKTGVLGGMSYALPHGVDQFWRGGEPPLGLLTPDRMAAVVAGDPILAIRAMAATADAHVMPEHARSTASLASTIAAMSTKDRSLVQWARHPVSQSLFDIMEQRRAEYARLTAPPPWTPSPTLLGSVAMLVLLAMVGGGSGGRMMRAVLVLSMCISGLTFLFIGKLAVDAVLDGYFTESVSVRLIGPLLIYMLIMSEAWWLNVFSVDGAWKKYVEVLTTRWVEQSEVTIGLWQQCRGLNRMAKQSLQQVNQELKGSWQNSLLEIAMKMADLKQHFNPAHCSMMDIHPSKAQELWLGVDRRLQTAFRNEVMRMENARTTDDQKILDNLSSWWMDETNCWRPLRSPTTPQSLAVTFGRMTNSDSEVESYLDRTTSLANLQHQPKKLHFTYPYKDFFDREDMSENDDDQHFHDPDLFEDPEEKKKVRDKLKNLEDKLKAHHQQLEALHRHIPQRDSRLAPLQYWRTQLAGICQQQPDVHSVGQWFAKWRVAIALFFAIGLSGYICWKFLHAWVDANVRDATLMVFAADAAALAICNVFLLYNYGRINLRHKHREFELLLDAANKKREEIEKEMKASEVLGSNPKIRALHLKAQVYTQSVNVIRNINYLMLCIKNEVQRHQNSLVRSQVVMFGLCMLEAIFCDQEINEQVVTAVKGVLGSSNHPGAITPVGQSLVATPADVRRVLCESARRKNMLLSMYHLHCDVRPEWQGSLELFVLNYLRPILLERRMPRHADKAINRMMVEPSSANKLKLTWGQN